MLPQGAQPRPLGGATLAQLGLLVVLPHVLQEGQGCSGEAAPQACTVAGTSAGAERAGLAECE